MGKKNPKDNRQKKGKLKPILFNERLQPEPYNASEVIAIADSRFLFCDNNISDSLLGLNLTPEGEMAGPIIRHRINGIEPGAIDDLEGMELIETAAGRIILATTSLSLKERKKYYKKKSERGEESPARSNILRIRLAGDDRLDAEILPNFRSWLIENSPELGKAVERIPDDNGLNVEALSWDPERQAMLFGVRSPTLDGKPLILRVRIKQFDGPWDTNNLEMLPAIELATKKEDDEQGIRAMNYYPERRLTLIIVGNSTSSSKAPFHLYSWDGNEQGAVIKFADAKFSKRMKVEGVTHGTINGRGAIILIDDSGGYQVLWDDDPRVTAVLPLMTRDYGKNEIDEKGEMGE